METVQVELPAALLEAAELNADDLSRETARLLALELYQQEKVSLGRAAELSDTPVEAFMEFAGRHGVQVIRYGYDEVEEDCRTLARLGL